MVDDGVTLQFKVDKWIDSIFILTVSEFCFPL